MGNPKSQRQNLILACGLSCDEALWSAQVTDLADIADISIADTFSDDSIAAMAKRLLDAAPEHFAIAGLSMGGYVAMEVCRQAPERVTRLALLDTNAQADTPDFIALRQAAIRTAQERGFEKVLRGSLGQLVHPNVNPETFEAVVQMALRVGMDTYIRQQHAIMHRIDSRPSLAQVHVPAMVIVGEQDRFTPPHYSEEMAAAIPGAILRLIADCGHMATMEQPESVNAALREWLTL